MPPVTKKDYTVLLVDIKAECWESVLLDLYSVKYFDLSKDLMRILLLGSSVGQNNLHLLDKQFRTYDPRDVNRIKCVPFDLKDGNDWLHGILESLRLLRVDSSLNKSVNCKQIIFITDLKKKLLCYDAKKERDIVQQLNSDNIYFYVIGPGQLNRTKVITAEDTWTQSIAVELSGCDDSNVSVVKRIINDSERSLLVTAKEGIDLIQLHRPVKLPSAWYSGLSLGTHVSIPVAVYRFIQPKVRAGIKKLNGSRYRKGMYVILDNQEQIGQEDVVSAYMLHNKVVPYSDEEKTLWKVTSCKGLKVMGFVNANKILEMYLKGDANGKVYPDHRKGSEASNAFYTLLHTLKEREMCAIASRVYNNNNCPKMFMLIPETECFVMAELPFREDIKVRNLKETESQEYNSPQSADELVQYLDSFVDCNNLHMERSLEGRASNETLLNKLLGKEVEQLHVECYQP